MNSVIAIAKLFKKDVLNPKYYQRLCICSLLVIAGFILEYSEVFSLVKSMGVKINVFEPAISMITFGFNYVLLVGAFLFLVSDAPYREKGDYLTIYRVGRVPWLIGKILIMGYYLLLFTVVILFVMALLTLPFGEFNSSYSAITSGELSLPAMSPHIYLGSTMIANFSLTEAVFFTCALYCLWNLIIGLIIVNSNLKYKRSLGIILAFLPNLADKITETVFGERLLIRYVTLGSVYREELPTIFMVMAGIAFLLIAIAVIQVNHHSMNEKE